MTVASEELTSPPYIPMLAEAVPLTVKVGIAHALMTLVRGGAVADLA
jgi:hypothetical protein